MRLRVTLAIPVYNGEKFIVEAINSILRQDYADFELIITDNASTDSTETICREFAAADARISTSAMRATLAPVQITTRVLS